MENSQSRDELEKSARKLMAKIRRADEILKVQKAVSDGARDELRKVLREGSMTELSAPEINRAAKLTDDYSYSFKIAEILTSIPTDDLVKTGAVGFKSEGFDKLSRINPDWAQFRQSVKKAEQKLTIVKLDQAKP